MCELCGQVQPDLTKVLGVVVCASARYCLLYRLKTASDLDIDHLRLAAVESTLTASQRALKVVA